MTYDELEKALNMLEKDCFAHKHVFFKLISDIETAEPNRVEFYEFLEIYRK